MRYQGRRDGGLLIFEDGGEGSCPDGLSFAGVEEKTCGRGADKVGIGA